MKDTEKDFFKLFSAHGNFYGTLRKSVTEAMAYSDPRVLILIPEAGLCYDYELRLSCWKKWESLYVERGYRTIPIETFIKHAYDAQPIAGLGIKRQEGENLIFFAPLASDRIRQYNTLIQKEIRKQINL